MLLGSTAPNLLRTTANSPAVFKAYLKSHSVLATGARHKRDLKNLEFHLLDTGHLALEEDGDVIADYIRQFFDRQTTANR